MHKVLYLTCTIDMGIILKQQITYYKLMPYIRRNTLLSLSLSYLRQINSYHV